MNARALRRALFELSASVSWVYTRVVRSCPFSLWAAGGVLVPIHVSVAWADDPVLGADTAAYPTSTLTPKPAQPARREQSNPAERAATVQSSSDSAAIQPAPVVSSTNAAKAPGVDIEFAVAALATAPRVEDVDFSANGKPLPAFPSTFRKSGTELGLGRPRMLGVEMSAYAKYRLFFAGVAGSTSWTIATDSRSGPDAKLVDTSSLGAASAALHLGIVVPIGPYSIRLGTLVGVRWFRLDTTGFAQTTCTRESPTTSPGNDGTLRSYPCPVSASARLQALIEPRLQATSPLWRDSDGNALNLNGFVGYDPFNGGVSFGLGLSLQLHVPNRASKPNVKH
jgi:hypothetical protein